MEYHEIGEKFEFNGVELEVIEGQGDTTDCVSCYLRYSDCIAFKETWCNSRLRSDKSPIYYKLVEQCKPKENDNMKKQIYYADLTPCDNMQDYKEAAFIPEFVLNDTKEFDTKPPIGVIQLATRLGWCIVAKWYNNGSTRIYALEDETVKEGVEILHGLCDSGECDYAFGREEVHSKKVSEKDVSVFDGYTTEILLRMEQKTEFMVAGTDKVFATHVGNIQNDEEIYGSLLDKLFTTYKAKDADYGSSFAEMFDELGIDYAYGKLREKMNRIKVLRNKPNIVENEGLEDALLDTAGYAILTLVELKKRKR